MDGEDQGDFTLLNINYHINKLYKILDKHLKICHKADVANIYRGIFHGPSQDYSSANLPFRRIFFPKKNAGSPLSWYTSKNW